jgi:Ca2+-binding EF-hand superfamily protein
MTNKFIVAIVVALFATAANASGAFNTLDADANGAISKKEASIMPGLDNQWVALDVDANGELSAKEFDGYRVEKAVSK